MFLSVINNSSNYLYNFIPHRFGLEGYCTALGGQATGWPGRGLVPNFVE